MSNPRPWFPLYVSDWATDPRVTRLNLEEQGACLAILVHMWQHSPDYCSIVDDDAILGAVLRIDPSEVRLLMETIQQKPFPFFQRTGGRTPRLVSKRLKAIAFENSRVSAKRADAASTRWSRSNDAKAMQVQCKSNASGMQAKAKATSREDQVSSEVPSPLAISATDKPVKGRWVGKPRFRPQGEDDFLEPNEYIVYRCVRENRPAIEQPKWQDFAARYCHKLNGKCRKPKCSECLADLAERLEWRMEKYTRVQPEKMLGWVVEEAGG